MIAQLPVSVPAFFAEACGYRGIARFVAVRWCESAGELWLCDHGNTTQGRAGAMTTLWRREGGRASLDSYRREAAELGKPPWLLFDRVGHRVWIGCALSVWRAMETERRGRSSDRDDAAAPVRF